MGHPRWRAIQSVNSYVGRPSMGLLGSINVSLEMVILGKAKTIGMVVRVWFPL